jgi:hypothetical protein
MTAVDQELDFVREVMNYRLFKKIAMIQILRGTDSVALPSKLNEMNNLSVWKV